MADIESEKLYEYCTKNITDGEKLVRVFRRLTAESPIRRWFDDRLGRIRDHILGDAVLKNLGNLSLLAALSITDEKAVLRFFDPKNYNDREAVDNIIYNSEGEVAGFYAGEKFNENKYPINNLPTSGKFGFSIRVRSRVFDGSRDILLSDPITLGVIRIANMLNEPVLIGDEGVGISAGSAMFSVSLRDRIEKPPFRDQIEGGKGISGWEAVVREVLTEKNF